MKYLPLMAAAFLFANDARSDTEGTPCASSHDCDSLHHCIDDRCHDLDLLVATRAQRRVHPFIGVLGLGGPAYAGVTGGFDDALQRSALVALRVGLIVNRLEVALEVSPFSDWEYNPIPGPAFQANVTIAYLMPITRSGAIVWPLRFGGGILAGNLGGDAYFEMRADLIGIALRSGHFLFNVYAPSFRYALSATNSGLAHLMSWESGAGVDYEF